MKRLLILLLCLTLLAGVTACGQKEEDNITTPTEEEVEQSDPAYALDAHINRFFSECITAYPQAIDPLTIRRGTDTREYLAVFEECNITVRNVSREITPDNGEDPYMVHQLRVTIEGGLTEESYDKMLSAFSKISQSIDLSCSAAIADTTVAHLEAQTNSLADYRYSSGLKIEYYTPIVKEHGVSCRIDLLAINYIA